MVFNLDYNREVKKLENRIQQAVNESNLHIETVEMIVANVHENIVRQIQTECGRAMEKEAEAERAKVREAEASRETVLAEERVEKQAISEEESKKEVKKRGKGT